MRNIFMPCLLICLAFIFIGCPNENTSDNKAGETRTSDKNIDKIPELITQIGSIEYDTRIGALKEIVSYGSDALPQLVEAYTHQFSNQRYYTLRALGDIGPESLPILLENMASAYSVRETSEILSIIGYISWDPVPGLIKALENEDADIRMWASEFICRVAVKAEPAIPMLLLGIEKEEEGRKLGPAQALANIGMEGYDVIPQLGVFLNHEDEWVRAAAAYALKIMGPEAVEASTELEQYLQDTDCEIGNPFAVSALSQIDPSLLNGLALKYLHCLDIEDTDIRGYAANALGYIGNQPGVLTALIKALDDEDDYVRGYAAGSIGEVSEAGGGKAVTALINAFGSETYDVNRWLIVKALGEFGPLPEVLSALRTALNDNVASVREQAGIILTSFGVKSKVAIPDLVEALKEESALYSPEADGAERPVARQYFANALGAIGPAAEEAVPALRDVFRSYDRELRVAALVALYRINPGRLNIIGLLIDELNSDQPFGCAAAAQALGELGADAAAALPELRKIAELDDPDPICINYIEYAAREAVLKIEASIQ